MRGEPVCKGKRLSGSVAVGKTLAVRWGNGVGGVCPILGSHPPHLRYTPHVRVVAQLNSTLKSAFFITEFTLGMILPTKAAAGQEPGAEHTVHVCWFKCCTEEFNFTVAFVPACFAVVTVAYCCD